MSYEVKLILVENKAFDKTFMQGYSETLSYCNFLIHILVLIMFKAFTLKNSLPFE